MGKLDLLKSDVRRYFEDFISALEQRGLRY
jgi:hypothetical protein